MIGPQRRIAGDNEIHGIIGLFAIDPLHQDAPVAGFGHDGVVDGGGIGGGENQPGPFKVGRLEISDLFLDLLGKLADELGGDGPDGFAARGEDSGRLCAATAPPPTITTVRRETSRNRG